MAQEGGQSPFGQRLRGWRRQRGLSQLQLASLAETTPRHLSFIETGRSRPGRELVLRLAACMDLPIRDRNALLTAAGLPPAFVERDLDEQQMRPFQRAVAAIMERHSPYPACAIDGLGQVKLANPCFRMLWPEAERLSPEQAVEAFFSPGPIRELVENFAEVAWAYVQTRRRDAARSNDPRLTALAERAAQLLGDVPHPGEDNLSPVVCPRFRIGGQSISTFTTVMRFEHAHEITISELRVELIFPVDDAGDALFRRLAGGGEVSGEGS